MGFPPKYAEGLVYQFYKKFQVEHEKKFPSKGEALALRWKKFEEDAKKAKEVQEKQAAEVKQTSAEEPKIQEIKTE